MYDTFKVITGIIVFLLLFTSPFWLNMNGSPDYKPSLVYPDSAKRCIADKEYMNHYHMNMLSDWRDNVVRSDSRFLYKNGQAVYLNHEKVELSLSHTCMKCHDNKSQFCDRCHSYLAVEPYCWDCHVPPEGAGK